jgi:transposase-like protein
METPKTLQDAILHFSDPENCREFTISVRWLDGKVRCPKCDSQKVTYLKNARLYKCYENHPKTKFSLKVGTVFEDSPIPLEKWLPAVWMLVTCKNGVSSYEIHRALGVTQKTAWFMLHRIRLAMQARSFDKSKIGGPGSEIEVDETFIGGKARNMHKDRRLRMKVREGNWGKTVVMGVLHRGGEVHARVIPDRKKEAICGVVREVVEQGSTLYTDEFDNYKLLKDDYTHKIINHLEKYVDGRIHTQGIENFWSLLKRGLGGTYVSVEPFHLFRYVDEQAFRYNNRATKDNPLSDADRFSYALSQIVGKRLTYQEVTGKTEQRL